MRVGSRKPAKLWSNTHFNSEPRFRTRRTSSGSSPSRRILQTGEAIGLPDSAGSKRVRYGGRSVAVLCLALAGIPLLPARARGAATLPVGFQETVVFAGLDYPTAVEFAPDGRVFVAEKSGVIKVFDSLSAVTPTEFANLRTNVYNAQDRGLLGMTLDPNFSTNPYVYVLYTFDAPIGGAAPTWGSPGATSDGCPNPPGSTQNGCVVSGRLSRLLVGAGNQMVGPEQVLINDWFQQFPSHSVGSLVFGNDGALYVSGGDGAAYTQFTDWGQRGFPLLNPGGDPPVPVGGTQTPPTAEGGALRAQDLRTSGDPVTLDGAILRVDPATGAAMAGNPLAGDPDLNARRIIAYGLRNPFRITVRPGTQEIWVGDVGKTKREEINRITSAADSVVENFGWPCYEGTSKQSGFDAADLNICENLYTTPSATSPYYSYPHLQDVVPGEPCPNGSSSISGLAFYTTGSYPSSYQGALFFADYSRDCMWVMLKGANGQPDPATLATFASGVDNPVELKTGPGGDLFYVDLSGGMIRRIQFTGANQSPTAVIQANPTSGAAPLQVNFDGSGSSDPNADPLTYAWDLDGDGAYDDSTTVAPTYTYTVGMSYTVRLRVTDPGAASATTSVVITAGDSPPTAAIISPSAGFTWKVGDTIAFSGSATDAKDGALPASGLSWSLTMHHCPATCHVHPWSDFSGVASGSFPAPDHEFPSHLELQLTATDSGGLTDTKSLLLHPKTVSLGLQSSPAGLQLVFGGEIGTAPFSKTAMVGSLNSLGAPSSQTLDFTTYNFGFWSDGGAQTHIITAPALPATYVATYGEALPSPWVNQDVGLVGIAGTAIYSGGAFTVTASGADIWSSADEFHFVYRPLSGDGEIVARVASQENTWPWAKAGVMIRKTLAGSSQHAMMALTPGNGAAFQRRVAGGGSTTHTSGGSAAAPYWVKLVRSGNSFTGYTSANGSGPWTQAGSATIDMGAGDVFVGLAVTSHIDADLGTVTFDNVTVNTPPIVSISSPVSGSTFTPPGTIAIEATAADNEGTVTQVEFFSGSTLLGTDTTSPYAFTWSNVPAGSYSLTAKATDDQGTVRTSAAVAVSVGVGSLPSPWASQDVGGVGIAGNATHSDGVFTVTASGADIWGNSDQFHYVYQPLSGDGEIVARVASQENTHPWAKAGVMIRQNLLEGSPHAMMALTPGNGAAFQRRVTAGGSSTSTSGGIVTAPYWVKLVRAGTTITGYRSPDGITWTQVKSLTLAMSSDVYIGLALTSHDNALSCTATIDNVSVN